MCIFCLVESSKVLADSRASCNPQATRSHSDARVPCCHARIDTLQNKHIGEGLNEGLCAKLRSHCDCDATGCSHALQSRFSAEAGLTGASVLDPCHCCPSQIYRPSKSFNSHSPLHNKHLSNTVAEDTLQIPDREHLNIQDGLHRLRFRRWSDPYVLTVHHLLL